MPATDLDAPDPERLFDLSERGWSVHSGDASSPDQLVCALAKLGERLGTRVAGRSGLLEEVVKPLNIDDAHPRSLSARYGLDALPFHAELSHRKTPCRYVLLGCVEPGSPAAPTMLLDWWTLSFSPDELSLLKETPIFVRTGRRSFYSTILAQNGAFLRYDPGCLEPLDERGRTALQLVEKRTISAPSNTHHWCRGDILIIDNWRVLHGRRPSDHRSGRRLARLLIDA